MGKIKRYYKPAFIAVPQILLAYFSWILPYSNKPTKHSFIETFKRFNKIAKKVSKSLNIDFHVEGLENLKDDETYCFISNHLSFYDSVVVGAIDMPASTYVAKVETLKYPFVGRVLKALTGVFIPRDDLRETLKIMRYVEEDLKKLERNWVIFPEGTRSKDERLIPVKFHNGTFRSPMRAGVSIVPMVIWGSDRVLKTKPTYKRYPVYVKFLKPITKQEYANMTTDEVAALCHKQIVKTLCFDLRRKDHLEMLKVNKNYKIS